MSPSLRRASLITTLGLLCGLGGCTALPPLGPVRGHEQYPGRHGPEEAFATFLWAWRQGDVPVLRRTLAAWLLKDLEERLAANGPEEVSAWFQRDAEDLRLVELDWRERGQSLAYLRAVLGTSRRARIELDFSLLKRPDGWAVSGKRLIQ